MASSVSGGPCSTLSWYSSGWHGFHRTGSRWPSTYVVAKNAYGPSGLIGTTSAMPGWPAPDGEDDGPAAGTGIGAGAASAIEAATIAPPRKIASTPTNV